MSTTTTTARPASAVLKNFTTDAEVVVSVVVTVTGGTSHNERRDAALDALEAFTERTARPVCTPTYETWTTPTGLAIEFRFGSELVGIPQQTPIAG